jgi:hypothetical protein
VRVLDLRDVPLGSVIDFEMTRRVRDPKLFQFVHGFGGGVPVAESRFEVVHSPGWKIEFLSERLDEEVDAPPERSTTADGEPVYSWVRRDIAAAEPESYSGGAYRGLRVRARLLEWAEGGTPVKAFEDSRQLSAWVFAASDAKSEVTPSVRRIAAAALAGAPDDPHEKARRLYAWVRDKVNYCAIEVGMGGYIPHAARKTEQLRYGDCKDKANLLRALLKSQGIDSHLTEIFSHGGLPRRFKLPTLIGNFNHMILQVELPDGPVLCDPTTRVVPFGRLPAGDQGADVLPNTEDGGEVRRAPVHPAATNARHTRIDLELVPGQPLRGTFELSLDGVYADDLRRDLLDTPAAGHARIVKRWVHLPRRKVSKVEIEDGAPPLFVVPVKITGEVTARRLRTDGPVLFRIGELLGRGAPVMERKDEREGPIVLGVPVVRRDEVRIALPDGASLSAPPAPVVIDHELGHYELRVRQEKRTVVIERSLERRQAVLPAATLGDLLAFWEQIHAAEAHPYLLDLTTGGA